MYRAVQLFIVLGLLGVYAQQKLNLNPIIGILTQPTSGSETKYGRSMIAASYVKFIESAGARVVPVFHSQTQEELKAVFQNINGLLFPGGGADLDHTKLYDSAAYLYNLALQANDNGDYFPIQGHCMGFELLNLITSQNTSLLTRFNAENISLPLMFYPNYKNTRLFGNAPQTILDIFTKQAVTMNNHQYGVGPASYPAGSRLGDFYTTIAHNLDRDGKDFVSVVEGKKYPIYALQWHAEKPLFEWNDWEGINHSTDAVQAMLYMNTFFVSEARKSLHAFPDINAQLKALIYNYAPIYTGLDETSDYVQSYFFQQ